MWLVHQVLYIIRVEELGPIVRKDWQYARLYTYFITLFNLQSLGLFPFFFLHRIDFFFCVL